MIVFREILFVLLVLAPLFIAIPLVLSGKKRKVPLRIDDGFLAILLMAIVGVLVNPMSSGETYWRQVIVLALSMGLYAAVWLGHPEKVRVLYCLAILCCSIGSGYLLDAVSDGYRDNRYVTAYTARREIIKKQLELVLQINEVDQEFPAGYIDKNSPILSLLPAADSEYIELQMHKHGYSYQAVSRWHTSLTGLYYLQRGPAQLWYPGGKVKEEIMNSEWRMRSGK